MGIEMEDLPDQIDQWSLAALAARCQHEIANFRKGETFNDRYCLEIFYRAITGQDNGAWELLTRSFERMVIGWLRNHPLRESAMRYENNEKNFVDLTFTRFWRATRNQAVVFHSLAAALTYLKASLHGELQDTIRAHARPLLSLPEPGSGFPEEPAAEEPDDGRDLWEVIESFLPTEREKRVAYLIIHCGLKPREVIRNCPGEFSDVKEVYRLHRNILERLTRNADQIRWRLSDEEL